MDSVKQTFTDVYLEQRWGDGESVSGTGSSKKATAELVPQLLSLIDLHDVSAMIDAPCGDFNWMGPVVAKLDEYTGLDIVPDVVEHARKRAAELGLRNAAFDVGNIITDNLPQSDLIMIRDCIVHLTFEQGLAALVNVRGRSNWLLSTTFPDLPENRDALTGRWRPLNLQISPYNLPPPVMLIVERPAIPPHATWGRKCMGLWRNQ